MESGGRVQALPENCTEVLASYGSKEYFGTAQLLPRHEAKGNLSAEQTLLREREKVPWVYCIFGTGNVVGRSELH